MDILFLGAAGTVTGSKHLVTVGGKKILVDCGLFQGFKALRLRNWQPLPVDPASIDAVILTHAHVDHTGYVPLLVKQGFRGPVLSTAATRDLCAIMLPDSARLQQEEAEYANRRGYSKHRPALPLYDEKDAAAALARFEPMPVDEDHALGGGVVAKLSRAGHILGATYVRLTGDGTSALFSGDLGRAGDPIMADPSPPGRADHVVLEATYGNRLHEDVDPRALLKDVINRTIGRGGILLIPSFAVGRAQSILYYLHVLKAAREIPDVPVYVNSPMARDVSSLYFAHAADHRLRESECRAVAAVAQYVNTVDESKALNARRDPMIVISASGMATGGRVLHHLRALAPDPRNTILFVGFQAGGTRGRDMVEGAKSVKIHGEQVAIRAEVAKLDCLSAHADYRESLDWLSRLEAPPRRVFLVHGEPAAADSLRKKIEERFRWSVHVPDHHERVDLS